ncbi:MAG: lipase family protein [Oculatellaceae cyanobacterium Prado106]|jgi:triacylglycerol lipase|nr:lipase family protein [Oculatellaceae cyanobacterium Prado106]
MFTVQHQAIAYSPLNALSLARASQLAYQDEWTVAHTARSWQFKRTQFFDRGHTQAFLMSNDQVIILAFRGTEPTNLKDWMNNANAKLVKHEEGRVHQGFQKGLEAVWPEILLQVKGMRNHNQSLFVTGHSLGGALATLAVRQLQTAQQSVQGLYTYGSPRVGDETFARAFEARFLTQTFRMVNHNDFVTRIAPRSFGYEHVEQCHYFDADGDLHVGKQVWRNFLERVKGSVEDFLDAEGLVADHDLSAYEANLQRQLGRSAFPKSA